MFETKRNVLSFICWISVLIPFWGQAAEPHGYTLAPPLRLTKEDFLKELPKGTEVDKLVQAVSFENHGFIKKLGEMRTGFARAALLRLAYGEKGNYYVGFASGMYRQSSSETNDARALLAADHDEVIRNGLLGMRRIKVTRLGEITDYSEVYVPLDDELLALFKRVLESKHPLERKTAAEILARMPGDGYREKKAWLIVQSIKSMPDIVDSQKLIDTGGFGWFDSSWSMLEYVSVEMAHALGRIKGLPVEQLKQATPADLGLSRDCLVIGRAVAGDESVAAELHALMTNSLSACMRCYALTALSGRTNFTNGDVMALEFMAANDTFTAPGTPDGYRAVYDTYRHQIDRVHWLRFIATDLLKRKTKRK